MKPILRAAIVAAAIIAAAPATECANLSRSATAIASVGGLAKLSVSPSALSFPNSDPDTVPSVPSSTGALTIVAKGRTTVGSMITLTVIAGSDLLSGVDTIAISALSWTSTGTGFVSGTMSSTTAQTVGSWTNSGNRTGTQSYVLANSWSYATGTYTTTLTYTLTAP